MRVGSCTVAGALARCQRFMAGERALDERLRGGTVSRRGALAERPRFLTTGERAFDERPCGVVQSPAVGALTERPRFLTAGERALDERPYGVVQSPAVGALTERPHTRRGG